MTTKIGNAPIIGAIASTLFWVIIYFAAFGPLIALIGLVFHPLIGKLWSLLVEYLFEGIDDVYELEEADTWGNWSRGTRIVVAAWWPILGPLGSLVGFIGILYGVMYKGLFK